jgi:hypothetical protein
MITVAPSHSASHRAPHALGVPGVPASRMAPPFALPGWHFGVALVFWLAGSLLLVDAAPTVAAGGFADPRVVALTHLFTLGWITTTILGALYQFLPVALGSPIRSTRLALATLALHAPGLALFAAGLVAGWSLAVVLGAAMSGMALLAVAAHLAVTLASARPRGDEPDAADRRLTWWALAFATLFLAATVLLGAALSGNLRWGWLGAARFTAVGVHLHVALAGWVMLTVVGVAHRLLPMFLLSHGAGDRLARYAVALLASGTALLLVGHHLAAAVGWIAAALIAGGVAAWLAQAALYLRHRRKPSLDAGLRLAAAGVASLLIAMLLAPIAIRAGFAAPRIGTAYVLLLVVGGFSLFVAGHFYKIVPFLIWFHRFGPLAGKRAVPRVADLYDSRTAYVAGVLLVTGTAGLALATAAGPTALARPAAILYALGAATLAAQMWTLSRRRP